jgi:hypothetical protein
VRCEIIQRKMYTIVNERLDDHHQNQQLGSDFV